MFTPAGTLPQPDLPALGRWLEGRVPGFSGLHGAERLMGGNSNPIWRLTADSGRYVLRTQPAGQLLKSAHALDREVRVLVALQATGVPVPRVRVLCNDLSVIGVQFYLMDFVEGETHRDPSLPEVARPARRALFDAALDMLARIHQVDWVAAGLADFGRAGNYFERQLHIWTRQVATALPQGDRLFDQLAAELRAALPPEAPGPGPGPGSGPGPGPALLHGDSRLDNIMFAPGTAEVRAVLDWELSTLGDPLADLGQFLAVQDLPPDYLLPGLQGLDRAALGVPSESQQVARYLAAGGRPVDDLRFYKAFALFRQAAMSAGLKRRALEGTALTVEALSYGQTMHVFTELGLECLRA